jgi:hypothetical protein
MQYDELEVDGTVRLADGFPDAHSDDHGIELWKRWQHYWGVIVYVWPESVHGPDLRVGFEGADGPQELELTRFDVDNEHPEPKYGDATVKKA